MAIYPLHKKSLMLAESLYLLASSIVFVQSHIYLACWKMLLMHIHPLPPKTSQETGNLIHGAYDELGTRYDLPEYCVSLPGNMVVAPLEAKEPAGIVNSAPGSEDGELRDLEAIEKRRREKGKQVLHGHGHFRTVIARLSDRGGPGTDVSVEFEQGEPLKYIIAEVMKKGNLGPKHRIRIAYLGKMYVCFFIFTFLILCHPPFLSFFHICKKFRHRITHIFVCVCVWYIDYWITNRCQAKAG